jgi:arylsulfatase A-like enzyme
MTWPSIATAASAFLGTMFAFASALTAEGRPPNVLFLLADDLRPDAIGALGNAVVHTPHLDDLVRCGTVFRRTTCAHPLCVPSRVEILTGSASLAGIRLPADGGPAETWPRAMRRAGYHTWYVGKWHTAGRPSSVGYEESLALYSDGGGAYPPSHPLDYAGREVTGYRGWVLQTDDGRLFPELGVGLTPDIDSTFADAAAAFLGRPTDQPFFLHVNFTAPHDPLLLQPAGETAHRPADIPLPPNFLPRHPFDHGNLGGRDELLLPFPRTPQDVRRDIAAYYAVVSRLDEQVGRVLAALDRSGRRNDTLIIFASDHGLALGSHGLRGKQNMYEHTIGVPLVLAGPSVAAGETRDAQCYLRDLFPTVCDLAGLRPPDGLDGQSLVPVLRAARNEVHPFVVGYFADSQRMIRTARWKYVWYPRSKREQLFDLAVDPFEITDLATSPDHLETKADLRGRLLQWLARHDDPILDAMPSQKPCGLLRQAR